MDNRSFRLSSYSPLIKHLLRMVITGEGGKPVDASSARPSPGFRGTSQKLGVPGFKHFRVTKGFTGIDRGNGKENGNYRV